MPNLLENQPIPRLFPKMALPCVAAMVANGIANLTSTLFATPLGKEAVAAMGIVFSAITLLQAVGYTVALGGTTLFSPALSTENPKEYTPISAVTVWLDLILGCVFGGLAFGFAPLLVKWLGATPALLPLCLAYGKPIFLSAPFVCMNYALSCLLRCVCKSAAAMAGLTIGAGITIGLTPLFFYLFHTGVAGAGWAFLAGQGVSFGILLVCYIKTKEFSLKFPKNHLKLFFSLPKYGISSLVRQGTVSLSLIVLNRLAAGYGQEVMAALSVGSRITNLCYSALLGWGQGFAPLGGYAFGKKDYKRLKHALSYGHKTALWGMAGLGLGVMVYGITTDSYSKLLLISQGLTFPFIPLGVFTAYGYQTIKKPLVATLISCLRQGICYLPLLFLLPRFLGVTGLLIAGSIADVTAFVLCLLPYRKLTSCFSGGKVI